MKKRKYTAPHIHTFDMHTDNGLLAGSEGIGVSGSDATQPQRVRTSICYEEEMEEE